MNQIPLTAAGAERLKLELKELKSVKRPAVIEAFPNAPGLPTDKAAYLKAVDEAYVSDAYHSLSIEGYRVSAALIEKVRQGNWNPDDDQDDLEQRNALAARGYFDALEKRGTGINRAFLAGHNTIRAAVLTGAGDSFCAGFDLSLAFYGSFYQNKVDSLTWDRLFTPIPGGNQGRAATEPDSDFQQFSLSGVYRADTWNTVVAFSAAAGQGEQTAGLLPYTINASLTSPDLPVTALDGKVDTTNYAFTLTSKPLKKARVKLSYRYDERDNQTPVSSWNRVITDAFVTNDVEQKIPYSFDRARLSVSGSYRLFDTVTISGGYDQVDIERDFQEVADQTEEISWGKLRWRPTPYLEATFKGGDAYREVEEADYDIAIAQSFGQNPLMRKFNLAERDRQRLTAELDLMPLDALAFTISYYTTDDEYGQSVLGLQTSEERSFNLDANYALSEQTTLYAFYADETIDARMAGAESANAMPWIARTEDAFETWGVGVSGRITDRLTYGLDYMSSDSEGDILTDSGAGEAPFPVLTTELRYTRAYVDFQLNERWSLGLDVYNEKYDTADWYVDGIGPADISGLLNLGESSPDYSVNVIRVLARFRL